MGFNERANVEDEVFHLLTWFHNYKELLYHKKIFLVNFRYSVFSFSHVPFQTGHLLSTFVPVIVSLFPL